MNIGENYTYLLYLSSLINNKQFVRKYNFKLQDKTHKYEIYYSLGRKVLRQHCFELLITVS